MIRVSHWLVLIAMGILALPGCFNQMKNIHPDTIEAEIHEDFESEASTAEFAELEETSYEKLTEMSHDSDVNNPASEPTITVSCDLDGTTVEIPSGKGRESLSMLVRKDQLQYIPLGTSLNLSFSGGDIPTSISLTDMVLNTALSDTGSLEDRGYNGENQGEAQSRYGIERSILEAYDGEYTMYVGTNLNAMYLDDAEAYKPAGIVRGFLLDCYFGDGETITYAVAVKTDIAFGLKEKPSSAYLMAMCGTGIDVFTNSYLRKDGDGIKLTFTMDNQSAKDFSYGEEPVLMRYQGPKAQEVPLLEGVGWNDMEYTLKRGKRVKLNVDLGQFYGSLIPGYYRFLKHLTNTETGQVQTVSVDFVIN